MLQRAEGTMQSRGECCHSKKLQNVSIQAYTKKGEEGVTLSHGLWWPVKEARERQGLPSLALGRSPTLFVMLVTRACRERCQLELAGAGKEEVQAETSPFCCREGGSWFSSFFLERG